METIVTTNNNCELVASPYLSEDDKILDEILNPCNKTIDNCYYIEFVVNPNIDSNATMRIANKRDHYTLSLPKDGLYIYYIVSVLDESLVSADYPDLYYDSKKKKLILNKKEVSNITELVPYLQISSGSIEYDEIPIFSVCKLRKCVMKSELESMRNCLNKNSKCASQKDRQNKDFLFISLYILENLICQERYSEATNILERIASCSTICNDSKYNDRKCSCNG